MVYPEGLQLHEWTDVCTLFLGQFDSIQALDRSDDDWKTWGIQLQLSLALNGFTIPDPRSFDDWRIWAQRLCEELR